MGSLAMKEPAEQGSTTWACSEGEAGESVQAIFTEPLFRNSIIRERKRTERSGLAMAMLLVGLQRGRQQNGLDIFPSVAQVLTAIKSEIDILGWYEQQTVIGLIVPDIEHEALTATCEHLEGRFRREMSVRFGQENADRLAIRLRVYPEPHRLREEDLQNVDPYLYPELHANQEAISHFHFLKRGMDICASSLLLILLSPVFLTIAAIIKLSSRGPVIFRQIRIGQMMKPFMMYKFRTMYPDADNDIHHHYVSWFITSSGKTQRKGQSSFFKLTNDPRITPIGRLLRKTSLDELPQLWNVIRGEMSLVGPRPPLWYELQQYKPWHRHRVLEAKPGITGLWQVTGRSRTTFDEMVRLDLRYARGRSLWADIKILLSTPAAVIKGKGAC
jgi:lipopolysaccharide/colanic/teichoic acid biosynthesis glycosyltransferase